MLSRLSILQIGLRRIVVRTNSISDTDKNHKHTIAGKARLNLRVRKYSKEGGVREKYGRGNGGLHPRSLFHMPLSYV